ncbi:MBL fold metallo-hydrolase [bacterium]|nr:MBL fold metallo-hydrolase [candidate division CSSED10-310 bacterium]
MKRFHCIGLAVAVTLLPGMTGAGRAVQSPSLATHGAAGCISGSCHLLDTGAERILLDCGSFMDKEFLARNKSFPFSPATIDAVVVSHAHLDHCGRLPLLFANGYHGPVICAAPGRELIGIMLEVQHGILAGDRDSPLGSLRGYEPAARNMIELEYGVEYPVGSAGVTLLPAEHILGSAMIQVEYGPRTARRRLLFTGDFGNTGSTILLPKARVREVDTLVIESTYGNKDHGDHAAGQKQFYSILSDTVRDAGVTILPSFVLARTQKILGFLYQGMVSGQVPRDLNVYVASPTASTITEIYARHESHLAPAFRLGTIGDASPFAFNTLHFYQSFTTIKRPAVIIAPTADLAAGIARSFVARHIEDEDTRICFVSSYQTPGSLGEALVNGAREVEIDGRRYQVRARVYELGIFSGHGDRGQIVSWLEGFARIGQIIIVHGFPESSRGLAEAIAARFKWPVTIAKLDEVYSLDR